MLKTHYYGGIKKYQWLARPLALHGVVVREDGSSASRLPSARRLTSPASPSRDLLPHLAGKVHAEKRVSEAFQGEKLNIIFGSRPDLEVKEEKVKAAVLKLFEKQIRHGRAGLRLGRYRDRAFRRGARGGAGPLAHRRLRAGRPRVRLDGLCGRARCQEPSYTTIALLVDKEEIGSEGNTGAKSIFLEEVLWQLAQSFKQQVIPSRVLYRSKAILRRRQRRPGPGLSRGARKDPMPPAWVTASA